MTRSYRHLPLAAGVALAAALALGTYATPAHAQPRNDQHRPDYRGDQRANDHRDYHNWHHRDWGGPPVVYNAPPAYYSPPPVVYGYGPQFGINLPGVSIGIN